KNVHFDLADGGNSNLTAVYILGIIALAVLIIACINFVNLSIGMSGGRSKDIGIRKVAGAMKKQLILQFWSESVIVAFCAMILGILIGIFVLPLFNSLSGKELSIITLFSTKNILITIVFTIMAGIISGIYPALIMSGFKPVDILKGKFRLSGKNNITKMLVITQFSLSIILIVLSITLGEQVMFLVNKDLGYDKEGIIGIWVQEEMDYRSAKRTVDLYRERIVQNSNVINMTATSSYFGMSGAPSYGVLGKSFHWSSIDENYLKTLKLRIIQGRDFGEAGSLTPDDAIVNKSFIEAYEIEDPVGKVLGAEFSRKDMYRPNISLDNLKIIAVVDDFNYAPLQQRILPSIFCLRPMRDFRIMLVRINTGNIQETLAFLEEQWNEIQPDKPFDYYFHEERLGNLYSYEKRWSAIINYVSVFTIIIACMGLFGLSLISVNRRTKEIGIRKALGAKVQQISGWIIREFVFLVLVSNIIAWPAAYFILNKFFENYAYRIEIGASFFVYAGAASLVISVLTISYNTIRSALKNPVDSLRYE
ncbi:MAG: FtsX-like permease family protein, partial [bacterium]|nr:FtsX-like permease family protein [bacterium]